MKGKKKKGESKEQKEKKMKLGKKTGNVRRVREQRKREGKRTGSLEDAPMTWCYPTH